MFPLASFSSQSSGHWSESRVKIQHVSVLVVTSPWISVLPCPGSLSYHALDLCLTRPWIFVLENFGSLSHRTLDICPTDHGSLSYHALDLCPTGSWISIPQDPGYLSYRILDLCPTGSWISVLQDLSCRVLDICLVIKLYSILIWFQAVNMV